MGGGGKRTEEYLSSVLRAQISDPARERGTVVGFRERLYMRVSEERSVTHIVIRSLRTVVKESSVSQSQASVGTYSTSVSGVVGPTR